MRIGTGGGYPKIPLDVKATSALAFAMLGCATGGRRSGTAQALPPGRPQRGAQAARLARFQPLNELAGNLGTQLHDVDEDVGLATQLVCDHRRLA